MTTQEFLEVISDENRMVLEVVIYSLFVSKSITPEEAEKMLLKSENEVAA